MISRGVVGKRIARIEQRRFWNDQIGQMDIDVVAFVLEDGTRLQLGTVETSSGEYAHDVTVSRP